MDMPMESADIQQDDVKYIPDSFRDMVIYN